MICRIGAVARSGPAITIEQSIDANRLIEAITGESGDVARSMIDDGSHSLAVDCESPTAVYEYIGHVRPEMGIRTRTALAAAGRSRGLDTPYDDDISRIEEELAAVSVGERQLETHRQERAEKRDELERLREEVATIRGRLAARREHGLGTDNLEDELRARIQELSEAETTATAAVQNHERARQQARINRNQRERRFRLEDRLANRRRDARRWLVEELEAEFAAAVRELSDEQITDPFDCQPVVETLAIARIASYSAPLVLETDRFDSAATARDWLGGPVVRA